MSALTPRFERAFNAFADNGEYMTFESYTRLGRSIAALHSQAADSPPIAQLTAELENLWAQLLALADPDGDGRVARADFLAFAEAMTATLQAIGPGEEWPLDNYLHLLFAVIDADGDGRITPDEYATWLESMGLAADTDIAGAFASLDRDGNGTISRDEFSECGRNYWSQDDPTVPGARWMGP